MSGYIEGEVGRIDDSGGYLMVDLPDGVRALADKRVLPKRPSEYEIGELVDVRIARHPKGFRVWRVRGGHGDAQELRSRAGQRARIKTYDEIQAMFAQIASDAWRMADEEERKRMAAIAGLTMDEAQSWHDSAAAITATEGNRQREESEGG